LKNNNYNRNPEGHNQWILRSNEEIQKIIDKHPTWTKKDFRGEGKLNPNKKNALLSRKETERSVLKFYKTGKRSNIRKIFKHSTPNSVSEFKCGKINLYTLRNRASTKQIRDNMSKSEKIFYDKKKILCKGDADDYFKMIILFENQILFDLETSWTYPLIFPKWIIFGSKGIIYENK